MYSKHYLFLAIGFFCASILSCKKKDEFVNPSSENLTESADYKVSPDGKIKLGKKLENPYAIDVMQTAYDRLKKSARTSDVEESPVRLTHYYVRFLPANNTEYNILKSDTILNLYETPLDYSIELHSNSYHDPSIPADKPTWQYTSVNKDFKFPAIKYEILSNLYIPESDTTLKTSDLNIARSSIGKKSFTDALIDEAMILTKNYDDTLKPKPINAKYNPSGTITVFDTRLGRPIPLVGVNVRIRRWFSYSNRITDGNGQFIDGVFKRDVNYALFFQTGQFDVRTGTYGQAWIDGPKSSSAWNHEIGTDVNGFYAHIFRGAYRYHYGNIDGLKRPGVWSAVKYCGYDKDGGETNGDFWGNWDPTGLTPDIRIWRRVSGRQRDSDEIFSTTIHETAHASHAQLLNQKGIGMLTVKNTIVESWAVAVQWRITTMEYRERGMADFADINYLNTNIFRLRLAYQYWRPQVNDTYTSLFIDLVDDFNQSSRSYTTNGLTYNGINDNVGGYTLAGIESTFLHQVNGVDTWIGSLKRNLKQNKPAGVTDAAIDELVNQF